MANTLVSVLHLAENLHREITAALPGFLMGRVGDSGDFGAFVENASTALEELLSLPFDRQAETPLEVVRRVIEPLAPEDPSVFGPASASELGDLALEASLAWGLAKTEALSRPTLLVVTANLLDASRFEGPASAVGYRIESGRQPSASVTPLVAFVDLELDGADEAIRTLAGAGVRVVAYGPHVDDHALVRATALGASVAEPRSRLFRNPSEYLRPLV
jgi:hypothetical protein